MTQALVTSQVNPQYLSVSILPCSSWNIKRDRYIKKSSMVNSLYYIHYYNTNTQRLQEGGNAIFSHLVLTCCLTQFSCQSCKPCIIIPISMMRTLKLKDAVKFPKIRSHQWFCGIQLKVSKTPKPLLFLPRHTDSHEEHPGWFKAYLCELERGASSGGCNSETVRFGEHIWPSLEEKDVSPLSSQLQNY